MTVRPGELDLDEFVDLASQGEAELDMGNSAAAAASLMQALMLWGDPPLPDLPDTAAAVAAAAGLMAQRQAAVDALIDARLASGEHQQVLGQLRAAALADPGRERTCAQLMRAYYALGMRKEAMYAYQRAREAMLEEQGAEPGPLLVSLQSQILAAEIGLGAPPAHAPVFPSSPAALPAWQAPAPPSDFTGRADELILVTKRLSGPGVPVVVIAGGPGSGKSVLAATAAQTLRDRFPGGQLYAELGGAATPRNAQDVLADVMYSLGVNSGTMPPAGSARVALYRSILGRHQVMVIADGAVSAGQVRPLIPPASGSAVLVTSRGRVSGLEGAWVLELDELNESDAMALFEITAGSARVDADAASTAAVLRACAGLPLAVRLAGTALAGRPGLTIAGLAKEMDKGNALNILAAGDTSVVAAVSSSLQFVPNVGVRALADVAVRVPADIPDWTLTIASAGDTAIAGSLAAAGLISPVSDERAGLRYRMHPLTRAVILARSAATGDAELSSRLPLLAGWLLRADNAYAEMPAVPHLPPAPPLPDATRVVLTAPETDTFAWLDAEAVNLSAAIAQACEAGDHVGAMALATRLVGRQITNGRHREATSIWRRIKETAMAEGDPEAVTMASYYLAVLLAESRGNVDEAARTLGACLPELEARADRSAAAMGHALLARCNCVRGRHAGALRAARHAHRLAVDGTGGDLIRSSADSALGLTLARIGVLHSAEDHCERALTAARTIGEPAYEAAATMALVQLRILGGEFNVASQLCLDGIEVSRTYHSEVTAARFMLLLGRARQLEQEIAGAVESLREAMVIFGQLGYVTEEVTAASMLAACSQRVGDRAATEAHVSAISRILDREGRVDPSRRDAVVRAACELAAS